MAKSNADNFNPYHQWLGIPEAKCPPTFYELLGISLDEEEPAIIKSAADRQRSHIEQFQGTEFNTFAIQLISQIDEAEITLLSPELRREYDRKVHLFKKRRKRRQIDPTVAASPILMSGSNNVGEGSNLIREYAGIVSILLVAFMIMAAFTFKMPWQKVVFDKENGVNNADQVEDLADAPGIKEPNVAKGNSVEEDVAHKGMDSDDIAAATIDAMITVIDVPGRSVTISRNSKTSILDVSRKAQIIIDGKEASLDSIVPNQAVSITFDPNYDVVTKIEVAADSGASAAKENEPSVTENKGLATVDVLISEIDVAGRAMTVTRNSKTIIFDVSRKIAVMVNGKVATLESLKPGHRASITFDPKYDVVVSVDASVTEDGNSTPQTSTDPVKSSTTDEKDLATIDATISAIDAADRSITISRKSKNIQFDVSRKVEVSIEGKTAKLESLKSGQKASITFNTEFDVVMKIEVTDSDLPTEKKN
tara:strand:+ start:63198 stop:64634 length:1437 start_codon:yes stop_codon:yes gene_type:complete